MHFKGTAHRYGRDIDTDVIIPARYLNSSEPEWLAQHCLEDLDADFVKKVKKGDIIVAEENFGCGSSREHAPIAIKAAGVDVVIVAKFDRTFADLPAEQFIEDWLVRKLNVKFLSIGDDFKFGAKRLGNFAMLQEAGKQFGFEVEDSRTFCLDELRISSTAIREALAKDDLQHAQNLLGKPYRILGRVIHGNKLGRTIGFPTANVRLHRQVNPVKGVYAVKVRLKSGEIFNGVANMGKRPTINGTIQLLEVHLFDFSENIYGQMVEVEFCHKIRDEIKFPSFEALKAQIKQDVKTAKAFFAK